jgi:hypothetical protein
MVGNKILRADNGQFLTFCQMPAHLNAEQAAWVRNSQPYDVPVLVAARLLKPLGRPPPNSGKYFATAELLEQVKDRTWLAKVTNALNQHGQRKNVVNKIHLVTCLQPLSAGNPGS